MLEHIKSVIIEAIEDAILLEEDSSFRLLLTELKAYLAAKGHYNNTHYFEKENVLFGNGVYGILLHENRTIANNDLNLFQIENEEIVYHNSKKTSKILDNFEKYVLKRFEKDGQSSLFTLKNMISGLIDNLNKVTFSDNDPKYIDYKSFVLKYDSELLFNQLVKDRALFKNYLKEKFNFINALLDNGYKEDLFKKGPCVIEAEIPEKTQLLNLDAKFEEQSNYVKNGLLGGFIKAKRDLNKDNIEYVTLDYTDKTGFDIYKMIKSFNNINNLKLVSDQLRSCKNTYDERNPIKGAYKLNKNNSIDFYIFDSSYIKILKIL